MKQARLFLTASTSFLSLVDCVHDPFPQRFPRFFGGVAESAGEVHRGRGVPLAARGHPRYIRDLDVWIELGPENARRIALSLNDFGMGGAWA